MADHVYIIEAIKLLTCLMYEYSLAVEGKLLALKL